MVSQLNGYMKVTSSSFLSSLSNVFPVQIRPANSVMTEQVGPYLL